MEVFMLLLFILGFSGFQNIPDNHKDIWANRRWNYVLGSYAYVADGWGALKIYENLLLVGIEEKKGYIKILSSLILRNSSFTFELPYSMDVSLSIYDIKGKFVVIKEKGYCETDVLSSGIFNIWLSSLLKI